MKAYVIASIEITNADGYAAYRDAAGPSVSQYGGRYLVRGGRTEVLDGDVSPKRVAVVEFPDFASARRWYDSPEYQAALPARLRNSVSSAFLVEGAD